MSELSLLYWIRGYLEAKNLLVLEDVLKILDHLQITIQMPGSTAAWIKGYLDGVVASGVCPDNLHITLSTKVAEQIPEIEKGLIDWTKWPWPDTWTRPTWIPNNSPQWGYGGTGGLTFCVPEPSC